MSRCLVLFCLNVVYTLTLSSLPLSLSIYIYISSVFISSCLASLLSLQRLVMTMKIVWFLLLYWWTLIVSCESMWNVKWNLNSSPSPPLSSLFLSLSPPLSLSPGSNCTVNFLSRDNIISLATGGGGGGGAVGQMKKKKPNHMITKGRQQLLFQYSWFNCSGSITQWIFSAKYNGRNKQFHPEIQVWRPSVSSSGSFWKVSGTTIQVTGEETSRIYTYNLATPLSVSTGDRLGFYQPDKKKSSIEIYIFDNVPDDYVYYAVEGVNDPLDHITISDAREKQGVPVISAVIGEGGSEGNGRG